VSAPPRRVAVGPRTFFVADDQPTFWDRVEAGSWEPGTLRVLEDLLGPGTLFVDIGAWVGALSLYAAALGAEVVAVEADPRALDQLGRNLAANPELAERVRVLPRALAAGGGAVRMGARRKPGDSMSSVLLADGAETWTSAGMTPGDLASSLPQARVDLVKIDIEGGEYAVLPTLAPLLESGPTLLLALHPDMLLAAGDQDPAATTRRALDPVAQWTCMRVDAAGLVPAEFDDIPASGSAEWLFIPAARPAGGAAP
jgi:FkbM family methyltransferase